MKTNNVIVGMFVVGAIALFAAAMFLIGRQRSFFAKHIEIYTQFSDVSGIAKGTQVRVGGLEAGEVTEIAVSPYTAKRFRLQLKIDEQLRSLVRTNSTATIATEGVVGEKFVLIDPGTTQAPEAAPYSSLPSKEAPDIAALLNKTSGLLDQVSGTVQSVQGHLTEALDGLTTAVNNVNGLVVDLKEGKGAVGMLLRDETTAKNIQTTISNVQEATASLDHASKQADALVSDFASRGLAQKTDDTMSSVQDAARNFDAVAQKVHRTVDVALSADDQGMDAGTNIQQSLSNLNQASENMVEDTEALKHNFLLRRFFKKRGYYSLARLTPDTYRTDKLFTNSKNPRVWLRSSELFENQKKNDEALSPAGKAQIDSAITGFGDRALTSPLVVEGYSATSDSAGAVAISIDRAMLVRKYLQFRFQLDSQQIGVVPLRGAPPANTHKPSWDGVSIVLLAQNFRER